MLENEILLAGTARPIPPMVEDGRGLGVGRHAQANPSAHGQGWTAGETVKNQPAGAYAPHGIDIMMGPRLAGADVLLSRPE